MNNRLYPSVALASGGFLAAMIFLNGQLAGLTSPVVSSFTAHLAGTAGSWILWRTTSRSSGFIPFSKSAPYWAYTGGLAGSMTVVVANITVNSSLGLAGSLSLMMLGQTLFAALFDISGFFGMKKQRISSRSLIQILCIAAGAVIIINSGRSL